MKPFEKTKILNGICVCVEDQIDLAILKSLDIAVLYRLPAYEIYFSIKGGNFKIKFLACTTTYIL